MLWNSREWREIDEEAAEKVIASMRVALIVVQKLTISGAIDPSIWIITEPGASVENAKAAHDRFREGVSA
jgi:hypothetical protein